MKRAVHGAAAWALLAGCAARVDLSASVPGAVATQRDGTVYALPAEIRTRLPALRAHRVAVHADGFVEVEVDVGRRAAWASGFPPAFLVGRTLSVEVVLVPEAGAGT